MTYKEYKEEVESIVLDAKEQDYQDAYDYLRETIDGHEWVIYYSQAWDLVTMLRNYDTNMISQAEDYLEETGYSIDKGINALMTQLAYSILLNACQNELSEEL